MATTYALAAQFSVGVWTDITHDLTDAGIKAQRGFQSNAPDDLVAGPAALSFGLDNSPTNAGATLGYYSPDYSGKRSGWALGIPIRFQVTANGTTRTRFIGWLDVITVQTGLYDGDQSVACTAVGWLAIAATTIATSASPQVLKRGDELLAALVALVPFAPAATSFMAGLDTYQYAFDDLDPTSSTVLDGIDALTKSGFDRVYEKADGTVVFETRGFRQTRTTNTIVLADVAPPGYPGLALTALPVERRRDQIRNRFQATAHPKRVDLAPVVLYALQTTGSPQTVGPGETVTFQGNFVDPSQQAQEVGGFNMLISDGAGGSTIGTSGDLPAADFAFGSAAGLTDMTAFVTVTVVYAVGQVTFTVTNSSAVQSAEVTLLQCRGQGVYDYQVAIASGDDAPSVATASQVTTTLDCPYQSDPAFADAVVLWALHTYAPSRTPLDGGVRAFVTAGDELSMDALLQLEISTPIGITETVSGLSAGNYWINSITEEWDERCHCTFTFALTPRDPTLYFTLDVSMTDSTDVLAAI